METEKKDAFDMFVDQQALRLDGENTIAKSDSNPLVFSEPVKPRVIVKTSTKPASGAQTKTDIESESEGGETDPMASGEETVLAPTHYTIELNAK